ncbi:transglutaminase domain-containing protein [Helicobacter sp. 10-6591]|uniref:transglutaminase domain-containing protein n=1 Tax=Helicobacter sp. 10-6591 TaxID=2004998 RepID=UPI000DCED243|nr:transglutaminase domain-containing protein [Helicobacter sp. 10-6591]RAX55905.1 hypothetical protein CCY97_02055 [Helicobacter sp. 10-6591]
MGAINLQRRNFLQKSCTAAGVLASTPAFGYELFESGSTHKAQLYFSYNVDFATSSSLALYMPLPLSLAGQNIASIKIEGNHKDYEIITSDWLKVLKARWEESIASKNLDVIVSVELKHSTAGLDLKDSHQSGKNLLLGDALQNKAHSLKKASLTQEQKALEAFEWVSKNLDSYQGQYISGIRTITSKDNELLLRGENISASSVFVELCRLSGLEAREAFGISLHSQSNLLKVHRDEYSKHQYVRSVVKIADKWVANDVLKAIQARESHNPSLVDSAFKSWDNKWVLLNFSRDIVVDSKHLATLDAIYGEVDGTRLSSYDMEHFKYAMFA